MNPRFTLALVALILVGGVTALWRSDHSAEVPIPNVPSAAVSEAPAGIEEPLPPPQDYVLAISWHAAFCETKPGLRECREKRSGDYTATHFALHGLWPQNDEYCGVRPQLIEIDQANRWDELPEIDISSSTRRELVRLMPGTMEQLERHEWVLHGSCSGVSAERYFTRAIALVEAINGSSVRDLFADNSGNHIASAQIRAAIDSAFGAAAGRKVRVDCEPDGSRELVYELRINLSGNAMGNVGLTELIHQGRNTSVGCTGGIVDLVGEQ